jgi:hypothetical protein
MPGVKKDFFPEKSLAIGPVCMVCPKAETSPTLEKSISKFKNMSA